MRLEVKILLLLQNVLRKKVLDYFINVYVYKEYTCKKCSLKKKFFDLRTVSINNKNKKSVTT